MTTWLEHVERWRDCQLCPLAQQRTNIVLARAGMVGGPTTGGSLPCDVLFVGEAPGKVEDDLGLPFVGPAGSKLQDVIDRALPDGMTYACCNLVCCFPAEAKSRGDNEPERAEILACRPRLREFIGMVRPKLIVCVGHLASDYIEHDAYGKVMGAEVIDVVHPAFILARMPQAQRGMALNKCVVVIRSAVARVIG